MTTLHHHSRLPTHCQPSFTLISAKSSHIIMIILIVITGQKVFFNYGRLRMVTMKMMRNSFTKAQKITSNKRGKTYV